MSGLGVSGPGAGAIPRTKRPRVVLVNPKMSAPRAARLPLSLLALGAVLEQRADYRIIDGNVDPDAVASTLAAVAEGCDLLGLTVMPGPQVAPAIAISRAVRRAHPRVPIVWGGYFPTLYPDAAVNAPYVDYVARGQGQDTLLELLELVTAGGAAGNGAGGAGGNGGGAGGNGAGGAGAIDGLTFKADGAIVHNRERSFKPPDAFPPFPYQRLGEVSEYLRPSFMGRRTAVHEAAIGCRYRCTFCGVVSMFDGVTELPLPGRLERTLTELAGYGADCVQFYDNNFFDREESSVPVLEVLARAGLPWWCYARTDTLANFSAATWQLIERSRLAMTYVGAEAASDALLRTMKKGTKVEQTFEVAHRAKEHGVVPEFSFVLGGPDDPEGEIEKTFRFIKRLKAIHPTCEVILYFYSPTPQRDRKAQHSAGQDGRIPLLDRYGPQGPELPATPEEWTEKRWLDYVCHRDAPWLTPRMRQRVKDFRLVLGCRFPTVQDHTTPAWGKALLSGLARWRYASGRYGQPWELAAAKRLIPLKEPETEGL